MTLSREIRPGDHSSRSPRTKDDLPVIARNRSRKRERSHFSFDMVDRARRRIRNARVTGRLVTDPFVLRPQTGFSRTRGNVRRKKIDHGSAHDDLSFEKRPLASQLRNNGYLVEPFLPCVNATSTISTILHCEERSQWIKIRWIWFSDRFSKDFLSV